MEIIPVINCQNRSCVEERLSRVSPLDPSWVQFDVSDGIFAPTPTWNNPEDLEAVRTNVSARPNIEAHLMVSDPAAQASRWARAGAERLILHMEKYDPETLVSQKREFPRVEFGIALLPSTPLDALAPYLEHTDFIQLLAVQPGPSGQTFDESVIDRIKALRERAPSHTIEIDGGVNEDVARRIREAGADAAASGAYLFSSPDIQDAYQKLSHA